MVAFIRVLYETLYYNVSYNSLVKATIEFHLSHFYMIKQKRNGLKMYQNISNKVSFTPNWMSQICHFCLPFSMGK